MLSEIKQLIAELKTGALGERAQVSIHRERVLVVLSTDGLSFDLDFGRVQRPFDVKAFVGGLRENAAKHRRERTMRQQQQQATDVD